MLIGFFTSLILVLLLYFHTKGKYEDYLEPLDKTEYRLKDFLGIGFFIMEKTGYTYQTLYDRKIRLKTAQYNGARFADYYLWVHWANKTTSLVLGVVLCFMIGSAWGKVDWTFPLMIVLFLVVLFFALDQELVRKIEKRKFSLQQDFPDFLNKLTLLINAGMTVGAAWGRIVEESRKETLFYEKARVTHQAIKNGKSEAVAFEDFARSCRVAEITKFVSILIQNQRKGNSEMVNVLKSMANECWELRKNVAKVLGEEASSKLLLPMMFNFLVIVVIVAMPAVMAMKM
jgi:tight adherence protein C